MDRVAVFVDAGYVFAQGSVLLAGKKLTRSEVVLDHEAAAQTLRAFASTVAHVPLLRIYWYDGTSTGPTAQHLALAFLQDMKVRLGFVNTVGEQKGVDSLIVTDMINLARNRAISDAVLISGDEDLRVGVQQAQEFGIRVHLVGIRPSRGSQSLFLLQEADTTHEWSELEIQRFLSLRAKTVTPTASAPAVAVVSTTTTTTTVAVTDPFGSVIAQVAEKLDPTELQALVDAYEGTRQIPLLLDRQLLGGGRSALGRILSSAEKKEIRERFITLCRTRMTANQAPPHL